MGPRRFQSFLGRVRVFIAALAGLAAYAVLPASISAELRAVAGWDVGLILYFTWFLWVVATATPEAMRRRARAQDVGDWLILALVVCGVAASFAAISDLLQSAKGAGLSGTAVAWRAGLSAATVFGVWSLLHTVFAIHYAHRWYAADEAARPLDFPGPDRDLPLYGDFMYFSFVVGMTAQVSDVQVMSRAMRRQVLFHSILSFIFNTVILAYTVNISAGLFS